MWSTNQPKSKNAIKREKETQTRRERRKRNRQRRRQNTDRTTVQVIDNPLVDDQTPGVCPICLDDEDTDENPVIRPPPCKCNASMHYLCLVRVLSRQEYARSGRCTVCQQPYRCPWIIVQLRNTFRQYYSTHSVHNRLTMFLIGILGSVGALVYMIPVDHLDDDSWTVYFLSVIAPIVCAISAGSLLTRNYIEQYRQYLDWCQQIDQLPCYEFTRYNQQTDSYDPETGGHQYDARQVALEELARIQMIINRDMQADIRADIADNYTPLNWSDPQMADDYHVRARLLVRLVQRQNRFTEQYPEVAKQVYVYDNNDGLL